jgi:hypothetical protein
MWRRSAEDLSLIFIEPPPLETFKVLAMRFSRYALSLTMMIN